MLYSYIFYYLYSYVTITNIIIADNSIINTFAKKNDVSNPDDIRYK